LVTGRQLVGPSCSRFFWDVNWPDEGTKLFSLRIMGLKSRRDVLTAFVSRSGRHGRLVTFELLLIV
jgi:hypothetical protein